MNIGILLGTIFMFTIIVMLCYYMFITGANDLATKFIEESRKEINALLAQHNLQLYNGMRNRDTAPCDLKYAINYKEGYIKKELLYFLPSRKIKQLVVELKRREIEAHEIVNYGLKHGKSNAVITKWSKI